MHARIVESHAHTRTRMCISYCFLCIGTTERIFQVKKHLYDVFVDNQNITTHITSLDPIIKLTPADTQRFDHLNGIRYVHPAGSFPCWNGAWEWDSKNMQRLSTSVVSGMMCMGLSASIPSSHYGMG